MDLNSILIFTRVVRTSSFTKAAAELAVTKSTISKKISELETELGTTLLRRTTRSLQMTEMGRQYYEQVTRGLSEIKEANEFAQASSQEPFGVLRVTLPSDFAPDVMSPIFAGFITEYPKVTIELVMSDRVLDMVADNIDVAIRLGKLSDSNLRAKKVGSDVFRFVASPAYLKRAKEPAHPADLTRHSCLLFSPKSELRKYTMNSGGSRFTYEPTPTFIANNVSAIKGLAAAGAGVALIPASCCCLELNEKSLKVVLPEWSWGEAPINLVYQKHLFSQPKVQAFLDYVGSAMKSVFQD